MRDRKLLSLMLVVFFVLSLVMIVGCQPEPAVPEEPAEPAEPDEEVVDTELEDKLVVYSSYPVAALAELLDAFESKYGVTTEYYREATTPVYQRYLSEIALGRVEMDIIMISDLGPILELVEAGLAQPHVSPEYENFDPRFYDTDGYWVIPSMNLINVMYNTDEVSEEEAPKEWEDLINPDWAGKMVLTNVVTGGTSYAWYYIMRQEFGREFHENLGPLDITVVTATAGMRDMILAGEAFIGIDQLHYHPWSVLRDSPDAPVGVSWLSPTPVAVRAAAIAKDAPHPNAAKLFLDFLASEEGQQIGTIAYGSYSPNPSLVPEGLPSFDELDIYLIGADEYDYFIEVREDWREEFEELYSR